MSCEARPKNHLPRSPGDWRRRYRFAFVTRSIFLLCVGGVTPYLALAALAGGFLRLGFRRLFELRFLQGLCMTKNESYVIAAHMVDKQLRQHYASSQLRLAICELTVKLDERGGTFPHGLLRNLRKVIRLSFRRFEFSPFGRCANYVGVD